RSLFLHDPGHGEHFGDRLDGNLRLDVAGGVDLAVGGDERDAVDVRVDLRQRRDVVRVSAFFQILEPGVGGGDRAVDVARTLCDERHSDEREESDDEQFSNHYEPPN